MFRDIPKWVITLTLVILAVVAVWVFVIRPRMREGFESPVTVTYYFLEGCPWCKKFAPEWEAFKARATKDKVAVTTVDVDAEKEPEKTPVDIKGFPTITITGVDGKAVTYTGDRTADALMVAVKKAGADAAVPAAAAAPAAEAAPEKFAQKLAIKEAAAAAAAKAKAIKA
jgi:thiol-disulfide isomerase/thioredoxin